MFAILLINFISTLALAKIDHGIYLGTTPEGESCQLIIERHQYSNDKNILTVITNKGNNTTEKDVLNTAPGKISEIYSNNMATLNMKYDEIGSGIRIQAIIKITTSKNGALELDWSTRRMFWNQDKQINIRCVGLEKQ